MPYITEERRMIQEQAREFTLNEVLPVANKLDPEKGDIPMDLRDKVAIDFKTEWPHALAEMAIQLDDGTTLEARHDSGIPWADVAKQRRTIETKFDGLVTPVLGAAGTKRLQDAIDRIDTLADVGDLARAAAKA